MTHKSIKLLALAVIFGCSLIGFALIPFTGGPLREFVMPIALIVSGVWFVMYWLFGDERQR